MALRQLVNQISELELVAECSDASEALTSLDSTPVELLLLDIEMPVINGFDFLEHFKEISFAIIFTTSYDQYAIKAIRFSALKIKCGLIWARSTCISSSDAFGY